MCAVSPAGRLASESRILCHGDEAHRRASRKRSRKRVADRRTGSDPAQRSVTEIVTNVAQHDVIGRNMPLRERCIFWIASS